VAGRFPPLTVTTDGRRPGVRRRRHHDDEPAPPGLSADGGRGGSSAWRARPVSTGRPGRPTRRIGCHTSWPLHGAGRPCSCAVPHRAAMMGIADRGQAESVLAAGALACPGCTRPLRPWGHARTRTVRDSGATVLALRVASGRRPPRTSRSTRASQPTRCARSHSTWPGSRTAADLLAGHLLGDRSHLLLRRPLGLLLGLVGEILLAPAGRQQRGDQPSGAEGAEPGGQRFAPGLAPGDWCMRPPSRSRRNGCAGLTHQGQRVGRGKPCLQEPSGRGVDPVLARARAGWSL
jgi:hypothetical protein